MTSRCASMKPTTDISRNPTPMYAVSDRLSMSSGRWEIASVTAPAAATSRHWDRAGRPASGQVRKAASGDDGGEATSVADVLPYTFVWDTDPHSSHQVLTD